MRCTIFSIFFRIKTNFYRPMTISVLQFYVKELLWNEKSREHRRASLVCECFWRARRSRSKSLRRGRGGQTVEWLYGCRRVMKTPRSDQEDLIRLTLQEEERFVYDETNMGHEDAAESKGPDQDDLDQRFIETIQEEEETLQELSAICQSL